MLAGVIAGSATTFAKDDAASHAPVVRPSQTASSTATEVQLSELSVSGERTETAYGPVNGYVPTRSAAGTKTDTPILKTARSIEVIGPREIEDRAVTSLPEAVRYSPGVTTNAFGFDPRFDQIFIRGFAVNGAGDYRDGLRQTPGQFFTFRTEPFGLQRIDIVKGPISVLYGQTSPGGLIDRISKLPTGGAVFESLTQLRSTGWFRQGFGVGAPLNDDGVLSYRLQALGSVGDNSFHIADDRLMLAPSLTWRPDIDTRLTILGLAQKDETDSNVAALNRVVGGARHVYDIRASDPGYDHLRQEQYQIGYQFEHALSDVWTLRQSFRYGYIDGNARYLTGGVAGGGFLGDVYRRGSFAIQETVAEAQVDTRLVGRFDTGPLAHTLILGPDYQTFGSHYGTGSLGVNRAYDLPLYAPAYGRYGVTPPITTRTNLNLEQIGLYGQDQIALGAWNLALGLRQDWASRRTENGTTGRLNAQRDDEALTYNLGLLYAFEDSVSPYVNYATSFLPSSSLGASGQLLEPTRGRQIEGGVKYQPAQTDSLFTLAAYHLVEANSVKYDIGCLCSIAIGELDVLGVELGARVNNLISGFDLIAAYNYNDARITKDAVAANLGRHPFVTPVHTASTWLDYTVRQGRAAGLGFGLGVRFVGQTYADNANTLVNRAYTSLDAALRYDFGATTASLKGWSAALNAVNLADERPAICNNGYCYLSQGRTVLGSLRYRW
ncbi:TonB-dependent siderophore receptor [Methylobacterium sp. WL18]|uniref:TonB-dependent siderophore receptor n=1 Tax=Methylobacterium sp. WL18 TaxID=2603897 RepID=UPI0011CADEF8|nr:TonB-dependent siderophore receptor [Methylobacterium sp. WL18]TXN66954.1 TonB-dependent siderophore receptor [Methylobacterium sp. WL18]